METTLKHIFSSKVHLKYAKSISKFQHNQGHNQTLLVAALGGTRWRCIALSGEGDTLTEHGSMWLIFIFRVWSGAPLISTVWLFLFQNTAPLTAHNILYKKKKKTSHKCCRIKLHDILFLYNTSQLVLFHFFCCWP